MTKHIEDIIDEKCRILNKNGTPKGGALHLAQWMKCQFDSQQQRHKNLMNAAALGGGGSATIMDSGDRESRASLRSDPFELLPAESHMDLESDQEKDTDDERIEDWTVEQVRKRSRELKLIDASGHQVAFRSPTSPQANQEVPMTTDDNNEEERRSKSPSRSTTSDSQITVRSSPIITSNVADAVSMCLQCHKHCKASTQHGAHQHHLDGSGGGGGGSGGAGGGGVGGGHIRCCQSTACSNSSASTMHKNNNNKSSSFNDSAVISSSDLRMSPKSTTARESSYAYRHITDSPMYLQLNGSCTTISSSVITATMSSQQQSPKRLTTKPRPTGRYCQCRCSPSDFVRAPAAQSEAIQQETCKLIENVHEVRRVHETGYVRSVVLPAEIKLPCSCETTTDDGTDQASIDPFEAVPSIAIVPPTPEGKLQSLDSKDSPDSNDSGQCEEPPYTVFTSPSLRRYGTMSSLEKVPSDERYGSSEEEEGDVEEKVTVVIDPESSSKRLGDSAEGQDKSGDEDIQVITKKVFPSEEEEDAPSRNWTSRAGSYMADKISFFEESRAFFDKYMGRWEKDGPNLEGNPTGFPNEGGTTAEECTSGATSGDDVWGTPSSGGENDEMQMFNSDQTQSVSCGNNRWTRWLNY